MQCASREEKTQVQGQERKGRQMNRQTDRPIESQIRRGRILGRLNLHNVIPSNIYESKCIVCKSMYQKLKDANS